MNRMEIGSSFFTTSFLWTCCKKPPYSYSGWARDGYWRGETRGFEAEGDGCAKPNKNRLFEDAKNVRELSLFVLHFKLIDLIRPDTENHRTWCNYDEVSLESQPWWAERYVNSVKKWPTFSGSLGDSATYLRVMVEPFAEKVRSLHESLEKVMTFWLRLRISMTISFTIHGREAIDDYMNSSMQFPSWKKYPYNIFWPKENVYLSAW
jgi:hypothetical protein